VQRLTTRAQFQAVLAGDTVARTAHFVLHRMALPVSPGDASPPAGPRLIQPQALFAVDDCWLGVLIPRRWARRAVTRNLIRRQIYTVASALEPQMPQAAHVVRLRSGFDRARYPSASSTALKAVVREELQQLWARARGERGTRSPA
jgi:ribonuclease P protein component